MENISAQKMKNIRKVILLYVPHMNNAQDTIEAMPMPSGLYMYFEASESVLFSIIFHP